MFTTNSFGRSIDLLHRSLDVAVLRRDVIANNIANSDTPNFKRTVVNFESALKQALDSERAVVFPARLTSERHIPFHRPIDYRTVQPRRVLDFTTTAKNNNNNVDIEQEMMNSLHNQLMYQLMVQTVSHHYNQINLVVRS